MDICNRSLKLDQQHIFEDVRVEELRLLNFRAFKNARLVLSPGLTFIIGHNASGKSTLLEAFELVRSALSESLTVAVKQAGGMTSIGRRQPDGRPSDASISVVLSLDGYRVLYGFRLRAGKGPGVLVNVEQEVLATEDGKHSFIADMKGFQPSADLSSVPTNSTYNRSTLRLSQYVDSDPIWQAVYHALTTIYPYSIEPGVVRSGRIGQVEAERLRSTGDNVGDVLWSLTREDSKADVDWIVDRLAKIVPDIVGLTVDDRKTEFEVRFKQKINGKFNDFAAFDMSDGTLRSLAILLALRQRPTPTLVLVDEIEDSIHPRALSVLLGAAEVSTERFQVVITSHSPEVLDYSAVEGDNLRIVEWWDGTSWIYPLHDKVKAILGRLHTVGGMFNRNTLRPADKPDSIPGNNDQARTKFFFDPTNKSNILYSVPEEEESALV